VRGVVVLGWVYGSKWDGLAIDCLYILTLKNDPVLVLATLPETTMTANRDAPSYVTGAPLLGNVVRKTPGSDA